MTAASHAMAGHDGASASDENAALVRRGYHAFNTADLPLLTELFDKNAAWHTPGRSPFAGSREGRDAILAHLERYGRETAGSFRAELHYVLADAEGHVVGVHRNAGERGGRRLDVMCAIVFKVENGRCVSGREHVFDLHTWDEFWS